MNNYLRLAYDFLFHPRLFLPTHRLAAFPQAQPILKDACAQLVLLDKDDTITAHGLFVYHSDQIRKAIAGLRQSDVTILVLSNGIKEGDPSSVEGIDILRTDSKKPFNGAEVLLKAGDVKRERIWVVGDRLMTDIYLANRMGCRSILVDPIETTTVAKHGVAVLMLRWVEKAFLRAKLGSDYV